GLPRLAVVGKMRSDDALERHPQVAVVVLVPVAGGRCAGHDCAAAAGYVDGCAEGLASGMFEDDVRVLTAGELANPCAEPLPLVRLLFALAPELKTLGMAVDDQLGTHRPADVRLLSGRHDAYRRRTSVEDVLRRVTAQASGSTPDEHDVALFHR